MHEMNQGEGCGDGEWWDGFERYLNVGVEEDLMIHWMQGDTVVSGWGHGRWCHLIK